MATSENDVRYERKDIKPFDMFLYAGKKNDPNRSNRTIINPVNPTRTKDMIYPPFHESII